MDSVNEFVTGEVALKLYRGSVTPIRRSSPYALYDRSLASFGESGGEFSQHASPGFIELFTHAEQAGPPDPRGEREVIYELIGEDRGGSHSGCATGGRSRSPPAPGVALTALGIAAYLATRG